MKLEVGAIGGLARKIDDRRRTVPSTGAEVQYLPARWQILLNIVAAAVFLALNSFTARWPILRPKHPDSSASTLPAPFLKPSPGITAIFTM